MNADELKSVGQRYHTSKVHTLAELESGVSTFG
jgi:hypothetical protein